MRRLVVVALGLSISVAIAWMHSSETATAYGLAGSSARGLFASRVVHMGAERKRVPGLSGGMVFSARQALDDTTTWQLGPTVSSLGCANRTSAGDVRINQDCTFRRQANGSIAVNPTNSLNLVAGQNDSSIGLNHCAYDYSLDGGKTWGSGIPPFFQRGNHPVFPHSIDGGVGTLHTYDAASDPSVAFDSRGDVYYSCVLFDVNDPANAIYVVRSPAGARGSYFQTVPPYSGSGIDRATDVVVEDNSVNALADEPKIAADSFATSRFRDRVYITWTEFISSSSCTQGGVCSSPIYFSASSNGGQTWSAPVEISGNSRALCSYGNLFDKRRRPHDCDMDEGSQPIVLPNGHILVLFNNSNPAANTANNQILAVGSSDGGMTWSRPVLVGRDVIVGEPQCNLGDGNGSEECVPGPFIRANDDPLAAVDSSSGDVYAVWDDYSAGRYAIHISESTNSGKAWLESQGTAGSPSSDAYMADVGISPLDHELAIGYYSSARVPNENKHRGLFKPGADDVGAEPSKFYLGTASTPSGPWSSTALSPTFLAPDGDQTGYDGDYSGMAVVDGVAHLMWSDARNPAPGKLRDEDVFTIAKPIP